MATIIDLIENGNNIDVREMVRTRLQEHAAVILEDQKIRMVAEVFCQQKDLTEKAGPVVRVNSRAKQNMTTFMVHLARKYGFNHESSGHTMGGKVHKFSHPGGSELSIHTGKGRTFWSHARPSSDNSWTNLGNGDTLASLRGHFGKLFPNQNNLYRTVRMEELKRSGFTLTESKDEGSPTKSVIPQRVDANFPMRDSHHFEDQFHPKTWKKGEHFVDKTPTGADAKGHEFTVYTHVDSGRKNIHQRDPEGRHWSIKNGVRKPINAPKDSDDYRPPSTAVVPSNDPGKFSRPVHVGQPITSKSPGSMRLDFEKGQRAEHRPEGMDPLVHVHLSDAGFSHQSSDTHSHVYAHPKYGQIMISHRDRAKEMPSGARAGILLPKDHTEPDEKVRNKNAQGDRAPASDPQEYNRLLHGNLEFRHHGHSGIIIGNAVNKASNMAPRVGDAADAPSASQPKINSDYSELKRHLDTIKSGAFKPKTTEVFKQHGYKSDPTPEQPKVGDKLSGPGKSTPLSAPGVTNRGSSWSATGRATSATKSFEPPAPEKKVAPEKPKAVPPKPNTLKAPVKTNWKDLV